MYAFSVGMANSANPIGIHYLLIMNLKKNKI